MEEINLKRLFEIALSLKFVIIGMLILMAAVGSLYSFCYVEPKYNSTVKLVLAQVVQNSQDSDSTNDAITQSDININNELVSTYSEIIKSKKIIRTVIQNLNLEDDEEELAEAITVSSVTDTQILKISVSNINPKLAKKIATEIATAFIQEVQGIYNISNINIIDEAEIAEEPYNINHIKDLIIFEVLGIFLSGGIVLIIYLLDTSVKDEGDVEKELGLPSLGTIPLYKEEIDGERKELLSFEDSKSPITECFRTLRTNLVFAKNNANLKNILVISSFSSEGKSYVAANLAMSFAKANKKVIVIDADMRKGRQHVIFNAKNTRGLSNCLSNISKFDSTSINQIAKYVKNTEYPNIHLIPSGTRPVNPLELISSDKMIELISVLDKIYDYVIIDGTPTNIVSDSVALSKCVDATVLVAEYKKTKIELLKKVKKSVENVGGAITGVIINKCPITERAYTEKYYYSEGTGDTELENKVENSEEIKNVSFKDLIKDIDFDKEDLDFEDVQLAPKVVADTNNIQGDKYIDYKLDIISQEINSLKDIVVKSLLESQKANYEKEISKLKKEIEELKK